MSPDDQVCSLYLAKKLEDLGINKETLFYYLNIDGEGKYYVYFNEHMPEECEYEGDPISAFTSSELGNLLPNCIIKPDQTPFDHYRLVIRKFISVNEDMTPTNNFIVNYECDSTEVEGVNAWLTRKLNTNIYDKNLSNAMAKMLIYLLENGFLEEQK